MVEALAIIVVVVIATQMKIVEPLSNSALHATYHDEAPSGGLCGLCYDLSTSGRTKTGERATAASTDMKIPQCYNCSRRIEDSEREW